MNLIINIKPECMSCINNERPAMSFCIDCVRNGRRHKYECAFKESDEVCISIDRVKGTGNIVDANNDLIRCLEVVACGFMVVRELSGGELENYCRWCGMIYIENLEEVDVKNTHHKGCVVPTAIRLLDRLEGKNESV